MTWLMAWEILSTSKGLTRWAPESNDEHPENSDMITDDFLEFALLLFCADEFVRAVAEAISELSIQQYIWKTP